MKTVSLTIPQNPLTRQVRVEIGTGGIAVTTGDMRLDTPYAYDVWLFVWPWRPAVADKRIWHWHFGARS